jgi:hypothetical protein
MPAIRTSGTTQPILDCEWSLPATEWCDRAAGLSRTPTHVGVDPYQSRAVADGDSTASGLQSRSTAATNSIMR